MKASSGFLVTPATCMALVARSMASSTSCFTCQRAVHTSTENKSAAAIVPAWAYKNVSYEDGRSTVGAMLAAFRILSTVVRAMVCSALASAPTIRESLSVGCTTDE